MCEKCVKPELRRKIRHILDLAEDFNDAQFVAECERQGVHHKDVEAYFIEHKPSRGI